MSKVLQRVLLALFVVVDVVLIAGAMRHVNGTPPSTDLPTAAASADPSPTAGAPTTDAPATATPIEPSSEPSQLAYDFQASEAVTLSSANDGTVVFGTRGRCADPEASVQISTNGGADFASEKTGLTTTLAVRTTGAKSITVVGTNADCDVQQITSTNAGSSWASSDDIDLWYPAADNSSTVVTPGGMTVPDATCVVTSLSQVTAESGRVSCADGTFRGSGDNGKTWVRLGRLDNTRVSTFLTPTTGFALARYNGCAANEFTTTDGGVAWTAGGCIGGDPAQAISATTNGLTAVVAGEAYTSTNNGTTWKQP